MAFFPRLYPRPRFAAALLGALLLGASAQPAPPSPGRPAPALPTLEPVTLPSSSPALRGTFTPLPSPPPAGSPAPSRPGPTPPLPALPSDPLYPQQWNLANIGMPAAWALWRGAGGEAAAPVTVAVLDTGYVASPELTGRVVNGYDFVSDPQRAGDGQGRDPDASAVGPFAFHGEVVANLIAAAHDGRGMAGINPRARIVHVRVADTKGMIAPQDLADGLRWAAGLSVPGVPANASPAKILNLSLFADFVPLTGCDSRVQAALLAVAARGVTVVSGAGNDGRDSAGYSPAGCRGSLTVTSVGPTGERPGYANWGRSVALAAPGGDPAQLLVASSVTTPGGEQRTNGTSFAAPQVAGAASLLLSLRPGLSPDALRSALTRSAAPFTGFAGGSSAGGRCDPDPQKTCGAGRLDVAAALRLVLETPPGKGK